jgi:hypothetical protein
MPLAHELLQRPNVLVAILTRETVTTKWAANHRNMILPPNSTVSFLSGMPFGHARDQAATNMLQHGFEYLMFVDDDVCIPADTIPRLLAHGKDIVSGLYYRRAPPLLPVMLKYKNPKEAEWISSWQPRGALIEVDLVGAGCLLIHRRVFEKMGPAPWFIWELQENITKWIRLGMNLPPDDPLHSEDFSFIRNARRLHGIPAFVDTSIECEHIGYASSGAAGYQPAGI